MADVSSLPEVSNTIYTAALGIGTAVAAAIAYFKKPQQKTAEAEVAVVSATLFSDRTLIQSLVEALTRCANVVEKHTECVQDLHELIEKDVQARHEEQIIRAALAKHGIKGVGE